MADTNIHLHILITPKAFLLGGIGFLLFAGATELGSESVTLATTYPAPSGIYSQMITTGPTYLARNGGKVGIGTTSPQSKLNVLNGDIQISTSTGNNGIIFQDGSKQTTATAGLQFGGWYCTGSGSVSAGAAGSVNPLTGGYSCPPGFTSASMFYFGSGGVGNCSGQCVSFNVSCAMCYK